MPLLYHIVPSNNSTINIIVLCILPSVLLCLIIIQKLGSNRVLILAVEGIVFLSPLIIIKLVIEIIYAINTNNLAYLLPKSPVLIHLYFESTLMLILLSTYILTDEFINILCLGILLVVVTTYGLMNEFYRW